MSNDGDPTPSSRLFRFLIRGGTRFQAQVPHNPPLEHDGGMSVCSVVISPTQAHEVLGLIRSFGCVVEEVPLERQTEEQEVERLTLLGAGMKDTVWPSASCPACAWFDPLLKDAEPCGRKGWPTEMVASLSTSPKPQQDAEACPVPHLWTLNDG